jgi:ADP-ribose pyrophosphatase YjhB (NUDIX family)
MNFAQKIYYNDKPLILTTDAEGLKSSNPATSAYPVFSGATEAAFSQAIQQLDKASNKGVFIEDESAASLLTQLQAMYQPIDAGGGVVFNEQGDVLMIYRRGKWDLPKGKQDEGEQIEACALREVSEETGLENLSLGEKICETYHIYIQNKEQLLKHTTWYNMRGSSAEALTPQAEENIMEVRWVHTSELAPLIDKSYEAIKEVLKSAGVQW